MTKVKVAEKIMERILKKKKKKKRKEAPMKETTETVTGMGITLTEITTRGCRRPTPCKALWAPYP